MFVGVCPPEWPVRVRDRFHRSNHVPDVQAFDRDQVVPFDQSAGGLVVEIAALVRDLPMPRGNSLALGCAVVRAALRPGQPLLRLSELGVRGPRPTRILDVLVVAGCGERRDTDVHPGLAAGTR